jgi:hypothetical protein
MPCSCLSRASIPLNRADASAYVMLGSRGALRSHLMIIWPGRLELSGRQCLVRQRHFVIFDVSGVKGAATA